jgi:hypothetical protein
MTVMDDRLFLAIVRQNLIGDRLIESVETGEDRERKQISAADINSTKRYEKNAHRRQAKPQRKLVHRKSAQACG